MKKSDHKDKPPLKVTSHDETFCKTIIECATEGICVFEEIPALPGLFFSVWNRQMSEICGYSVDEINQRGWYQTVYPDLATQLRAIERMARMRRGEDMQSEEWTIMRKDGQKRVLLISSRLLLDDPSRPRVLAMMRDITDRNQAEEDRALLQTKLAGAQRMESVGLLAGGVAHDFNNLLMAIMGYAELAREAMPAEHPVRAFMDEIMKAGKRSVDLTRQLLAFARKQAIAPQVLNLNETIASMLKLLQRLIGENIELVWLPGGDLWSVKLDPSQIDQLLANICINARDAIHKNGKIEVASVNATLDDDYCARHNGAIPGEYVHLSISDNGCGIDPAVVPRIFEPFFSTKITGRGTGLGLATVYGIVKQNHGYITVQSEINKGTTFNIYLPRVMETSEAVPQVEGTVEDPRGNGETILMVEDEKALHVPCEQYLKSLGYTVLMAETPAKALELARKHLGVIHLLLTDVIMPDMNGRQLAEKIGAIRQGIKILFMSGYTADVVANQGVLVDGIFFIAKPFSRAAIARKLQEVLKSKR